MKHLIYIQDANNKINANSLEAISAIQQLSDDSSEIIAVTFNEIIAKELSNYQLSKILFIKNDNLKKYNPLYYIDALYEIYNLQEPDLLCFGHTYETRDWVPRLSARLDIPFISDCIEIKNETNIIECIRPVYQAKLNEKIHLLNNSIISFQAGSYSKDNIKSGNTSVQEVHLELNNNNSSIRLGEKFQETAGGVDLTSAEVIVSVGRGIGKEENIPIAQSLADKLNAQIGASRPVVDAGWLDHSRQVGSSGQTVSPKLYFSIGISGAIQHLVGMKGSKNIIAINKDPMAPIFEIADYAVVGDIFEILPKLTDEL